MMKTWVLKYMLYFGVTLSIIWSCENPMEGFQLGFKEPLSKATLRIQFSLPNNGKLPDDLDFKIVGKDADKIVTNLNAKKFKISKEGLLIIAVPPEFTPSSTLPIKFTIVAESSDYLKIIKNITFNNTNNQSIYLAFTKKVNGQNLNALQLKGSTEEPKIIEISSFSGNEKLSLKPDIQTKYFDEENKAIHGAIDIIINHFDSKNSKNFLPNGGVAYAPIAIDNKPMPDPFDFLSTVGLVSIEMSSTGHQIIKKIDQPLQVILELNTNTLNPLTGSNIKEGDIISLTSFDTDTGTWKDEGNIVISKNENTGKLFIKFSASHLTYWVAGWRRIICRVGPSFQIKSNLQGVDISYYAQLLDAHNNKILREFFLSLNNGSVFTVSYIPKVAENVKLLIYDYNNIYGGERNTPLIASNTYPICGSNLSTLDFSKLTIPKSVELDIKIVCPQGKILDEASLPAQMKVQFSEPDKNNWIEIGTLTRTNRNIKTYRLQMGKKYDLRGSTDGGVTWPYVQKKYLVDKEKWYFELPGKEYCK